MGVTATPDAALASAVTLLDSEPGAIYGFAKRGIDVVASLLLLVCLLPVFVICAAVIYLDSPGPVLFRQQRIGLYGRPFTFLKFRSMRVDADSAPHRQFATAFIQGKAQPQPSDSGQLYKLVRDRRVTRVGHFLRRSSLDELPQLWNVLRGEMSLVGPRPPIPYEVECYRPEHLRRLTVKPGITGLWQVSGRSATTFEQMVALDVAYIRRRSLLLDLSILWRTVPVVLLRKDGR